MANYSKTEPISDAISEMLSAKPAEEVAAFRKELYNDINVNNMFGALESSLDENTGKNKLATNLTDYCMKNYDHIFGNIIPSKGDITKFKYYNTMALTIEFINNSVEQYNIDSSAGLLVNQTSIKRMNKIESILSTYKNDFEFGFKINNNLIKNTYCCLVNALVDTISLSLVTVAHGMDTAVKGVDAPFIKTKFDNRYLSVFRHVDKICDMFDNGTWTKLVREFRTNIGKNFTGATIAAAITIAAVVPIAMIALLYAIRALIMFYFESAVSISEKCKVMKEYIDEASSMETNEKAKKKQLKASAKLSRISGFIEAKILKEDNAGRERLMAANKELTISTPIPTSIKDQIIFE